MPDLETIFENVSSSNGKVKGQAACDLAEMIWAGKLDSAEIQKLLISDNHHVRGAVAWAIADLNGPTQSVKWLMQKGVSDAYDGVRYWAVRCASEMPEMKQLVSEENIRALCEDESPFVRKIALSLWQDESSRK